MLNDEVAWLSNFTPYSGTSSNEMEQADNALLAGHLNVVRGLLNCEGVSTATKICFKMKRLKSQIKILISILVYRGLIGNFAI